MKKLILLLIPFLIAAAPSRVSTYVSGTTISSTAVTANEDALFNYVQKGVDTIKDGSIINADLSGSAAIAASKLNLTTIAQPVSFTTIPTLGTVTTGIISGIDLNGGAIDGVIIGSSTAPNVQDIDINGGTLDSVNIGGTTATGELIVNDANDYADGLGSQGTAGQYLQSAGAGVNPTWAGVSSGGWAFDQTGTFTNSAGFSITETISAGDVYKLIIEQADATAVDMYVQVNDDATANAHKWVYQCIYGDGAGGVTERDSSGQGTSARIDGGGNISYGVMELIITAQNSDTQIKFTASSVTDSVTAATYTNGVVNFNAGTPTSIKIEAGAAQMSGRWYLFKASIS